MLIHVNVDEDVYGYLSKKAEEIERSVGQYCSELLTIWTKGEATHHEEIMEKDAKTIETLKEANKRLEKDVEECLKALEPEDKELTLEDIEPDLKPDVVKAIKKKESEDEPE